jgi:hypothetical protein
LLTYFYRQPPAFDDSMDLRAIQILKFAPLLMFSFGYWALSSPQLFNNNPPEYFFSNYAANPEHPYIDINNGIN